MVATPLAILLTGCAKRPVAAESEASPPPSTAFDPDPQAEQISRTDSKVEVTSKRFDIDRPYLPMLGPKDRS